MSLAAGSRLGPYEIVAPLGAGGMGEVYRARDARLNRDVALKVLPESFAVDLDRLARFQREAQVLASLSHPNIGHIYGIEDTRAPGAGPGGVTHALVLELIEGPTLADRMAQGPVLLGEAVAIAIQIADALEAAHEQGIVHRDLKPANIKVRDDGTVKVLDFGLAKAMVPAGSSSAVISGSPTMTSPAMTQMGMILGTAAYMAPEQAKGKAIDKRADIWAFGVVLFEMLTGQTLFAGDTVSETLAAVIKDQPMLDRLPPETPPAVRRLVARCLEREPKLRLRDIGEARIALSQPLQEDGIGAPKSPIPRRFIWMAAAGAVVLASLTGAVVWRARPVAEMPVRRFELPAAMSTARFAIAPDGSRVAYVAADGHLYVRAFDAASLVAQDLGDVHVTTNTLTWSPDGQTVAFTSEGRLRSVSAGGGPTFEIAKVPASGRALDVAWQPDNTILFSVWRDGLYRVPASGGTPELFVAVNPETEVDFHTIAMLPDRRIVVTTHLLKDEASYRVEIIDRARNRIVLMPDAPVREVQYAPQGYLLLNRFGENAGLWAVSFTDRPTDLGSAVLVQSGPVTFDAADDGTLLVRAGSAESQSELVWVDRQGAISPIAGRPFVTGGSSPSLSPDGRRAVLHVTSESGAALVVRDLENGADTMLAAREEDRGVRRQGIPKNPGWFPTGDRIVHGTGAIEVARIMALRPDGSGAPLDLLAGTFARVSPDGRHLLYIEDDRRRTRVRYALFLPDGGLGSPQSLFGGADGPNVDSFDLSPDGSMLAYAATQGSGQSNIFLTGFPGGKGRWQVTTDGGVRPRFSRDGRELFYVSGTRGRGGPRGRLNVIPVTLSPSVKLGVAAPLFEEGGNQPSAFNMTSFDIARDGRFLTTRTVAAAPAAARPLVLIQNWIAAIRK